MFQQKQLEFNFDQKAQNIIFILNNELELSIPQDYALKNSDVYKILSSIFLKVQKVGCKDLADIELGFSNENDQIETVNTDVRIWLPSIRDIAIPKKCTNEDQLLVSNEISWERLMSLKSVENLFRFHTVPTLKFFADFCNKKYYYEAVNSERDKCNSPKKFCFIKEDGITNNLDILNDALKDWTRFEDTSYLVTAVSVIKAEINKKHKIEIPRYTAMYDRILTAVSVVLKYPQQFE